MLTQSPTLTNRSMLVNPNSGYSVFTVCYQMTHPSIHYLIAYPVRGHRWSGADPSCHGVIHRAHPGQVMGLSQG